MLPDLVHHLRFLATDTTMLALVALVAAAGGVAWWLRRTGRSSRPYALVFAALAALALLVAATLVRDLLSYALQGGLQLSFAPGQVLSWSPGGWQRISYDPFRDSEVLLNIALFVPAGVAWTLLTERPLRTLAALAGLSLLVECLQAVFGIGANDVADLVANSAGAAIGVLLGTVVLWLVPRLGRRPRPTRRRVTIAAGCVVVIATAAMVGVFVGAEHRQAALERELVGHFAGTTQEHYRAWEADDRLSERVFGVASVFADGAQDVDGATRVRYPASFFSLRRCVFVEWAPSDVRVYRSAGAECTELVG